VKDIVRVGVLSTGNELIANALGGYTTNGKIPDANRPLLLAQLSTYHNCEAVDLGIVSDDWGRDNISTKLEDALFGEGSVDVIITTGGISMGEKDIMEQVFVEGMGGKIHFGRSVRAVACLFISTTALTCIFQNEYEARKANNVHHN
jgi:molybdenum cofactor synthesis domain-containing protein